MQQLFIVHGFEGSPHGNWFDDLAQRARRAGMATAQIGMPHPHKPTVAAWQQTLDNAIGAADENTFLVGHSLGCISLLHFLSRRRPRRIGGLLLAAGFADCLPKLPQLDDYIRACAPNDAVLRSIDMPVISLISTNDTHVPTHLSVCMAKSLHSRIHWIENGGHLMASDGFEHLPQAWQALATMLPAHAA